MITFLYRDKQYKIEDAKVTGGRFTSVFDRMIQGSPVFSQAAIPDRDHALAQWIKTELPIEIILNDPPKNEPEFVGDLVNLIDQIIDDNFKHLPGRHDQRSHGRGGGNISGGPVSKEKRVWQGKEQEYEGQKLSKLQTGELGEKVAIQALSDINGVPFETLNVGINNAPIDVVGDHQAIEVKTGLATNRPDSQRWRATIGEPAREEKASYKALIKKMSPETKREHNRLKRQAILDRKQSMLDKLTVESGGERIDPKVVGVIMAPDGKKADVFVIDGFHLSLPWRQAATDENYIGTYDIGE